MPMSRGIKNHPLKIRKLIKRILLRNISLCRKLSERNIRYNNLVISSLNMMKQSQKRCKRYYQKRQNHQNQNRNQKKEREQGYLIGMQQKKKWSRTISSNKKRKKRLKNHSKSIKLKKQNRCLIKLKVNHQLRRIRRMM